MDTNMPAPGWYPAPHANGEQRFWDGQRWLEPQPTVPTDTVPPQKQPKFWRVRRRTALWTMAGAVVLGVVLGSSAGAGQSSQIAALELEVATLQSSNDTLELAADVQPELDSLAAERDGALDRVTALEEELASARGEVESGQARIVELEATVQAAAQPAPAPVQPPSEPAPAAPAPAPPATSTSTTAAPRVRRGRHRYARATPATGATSIATATASAASRRSLPCGLCGQRTAETPACSSRTAPGISASTSAGEITRPTSTPAASMPVRDQRIRSLRDAHCVPATVTDAPAHARRLPSRSPGASRSS